MSNTYRHKQLPVLPGEQRQQVTDEFIQVERVLDTQNKLISGRVRWRGPSWDGTKHLKNDMVRDGDWLMIANKDTLDKPAPQAVGNPAYVYAGASPTDAITAKELKTGQQYAFPTALYLTGWRAYTVAGNVYRAFIVSDPDGVGEITELLSWEAITTGWVEHSIAPIIYPEGTTFELWLAIAEPDPTPTVFSGDWLYLTPPNPAVPAAGQIIQSDKEPASLLINVADQSTDRGTELRGLTIGDVIVGPGGLRWAIQVITDNTTWIDFTVAPAQQDTPDGVGTFTFETVIATPITTVLDSDYFLGNDDVSAYYIIDNGTPVATQDAYGIDIQVQEANISPDWDMAAVSSSGGGGSGSGSSIWGSGGWTQLGSSTLQNIVLGTNWVVVNPTVSSTALDLNHEVTWHADGSLEATQTPSRRIVLHANLSFEAGASIREFYIGFTPFVDPIAVVRGYTNVDSRTSGNITEVSLATVVSPSTDLRWRLVLYSFSTFTLPVRGMTFWMDYE
jgi:hypothetical protein